MSAYDCLVALYTGLSRWHGRRDDGGSMLGRIDFLIRASRFSSIHAQASGRLGLVITIKHLLRPANSIWRNHGLQRRWSCNKVGSMCGVWIYDCKPGGIFQIHQYGGNLVQKEIVLLENLCIGLWPKQMGCTFWYNIFNTRIVTLFALVIFSWWKNNDISPKMKQWQAWLITPSNSKNKVFCFKTR